MTPEEGSTQPIRVAVIGSGCAAMTTAFELSHPRHRDRYQVTIYQHGWRLGGKGASGRGVHGRIEEHGLHLWMGHYDNAFQLMRACYEELGRDPKTCPLATIEQAFVPDSLVGLTERDGEGTWRQVMAHFPPTPGMPGDPLPGGLPRTMSAYMVRTVQLLAALLDSARTLGDPGHRSSGSTESTENSASSQAETIARWLKLGRLATLGALAQAITTLEQSLRLLPAGEQVLGPLVELISTGVRRLLNPLLDGDAESRFLWQVIDVVLAHLRGCIRFGLATDPRGFDAVDYFDVREWLIMNGADEGSADSAFVRGLYDLVFGYEKGDANRHAVSAGQGIRCGLRMFFGYRGALFWKMQAGMGDVVFAPLYEVLKRRGVKFEFFHRLENVGLADPHTLRAGEKPYVAKLDFAVQADTVSGSAYEPLIDLDGLPCWPAQPLWDQLSDGALLHQEKRDFEAFWDKRSLRTKTLLVSQDFDFVVLGVGLGAIPHVASELVASNPRWQAMVDNLQTVATQAFQIWLKDDIKELGWQGGRPNLSGFVEPFDTWADMSHLAEAEKWPTPPRAIAYFCNALPDLDSQTSGAELTRETAERQRRTVRDNAVTFLDRDVVHLWPNAQQEGRFRWDLLQVPDGDMTPEPQGDDRFDTQFFTANVNPSDRYVMSAPGTAKYRISPLDETYDNLTIAGDWADCGFNFGCVEAAVMSGRLAAHALSSWPPLEDIIAYDHP